MGWGYGRYGGYGGFGGGYGQSKKATAASLSTATLQRILAQQEADARNSVAYTQAAAARQAAAEVAAGKERELEEKHGGKEALAKWRLENAARLEAERKAAAVKAAAAAKEKASVDALAEVHTELAGIVTLHSRQPEPCDVQMLKGKIKENFHLTDREIEPLPKTVIQKPGAKRPSKILYEGEDIFRVVLAKEGKLRLRSYQQAAFGGEVARFFVERDLALLEEKHPELIEKGRAAAAVKLHAAEAEVAKAARAAGVKAQEAQKAFESAMDRQKAAQVALTRVATRAEIDGFRRGAAGPSSTTPFTAGGNKKQRLDAADPSSAAGSSAAHSAMPNFVD